MNIREPVPSLVTPEAVLADKIASIAVPSTASSVWDSMKEAGFGTVEMPTSGGLGAKISTPPSTSKMTALQSQLTGRSEMASQYGVRLPSLGALGPPQKGIATANQLKNKPTHANSHGHPHGPNGECYSIDEQFAVDGGVGAASQAGNTKFVDDKGWPVTLKQILGSRMLTPEMLQKASIQNVSKLISVNGGTQQQNEEMKYMFQRMMLEGFIRGVDITKELERQKGLKLNIASTISGKTSVIGVAKNGNEVHFGRKWWDAKSEADRYTLFLHEVGHSLLNASHENNSSQKVKQPNRVMTPIYAGSVLRDYDRLVDGLFKESTSYNKINVSPQSGPAKYDPSWFPSLTGVGDSGTYGGGGTGSAPGKPAGQPDNDPRGMGQQPGMFYNNTTEYSITPAGMVNNAGGGAQATISSGGGMMGGRGASGTAVAGGGLSGDVMTPTKTFAAGMADLSKGGADLQQAGALLQSG